MGLGMNIALIGYRGTGKSTIGRHVAAHLRMEFIDADVLLVERAGKSIKAIFEMEGEAAFREREAGIIRELAGRTNLLIATGGGVVLRPENVEALRQRATVIWLQADAETLHARIIADPVTAASRPHLAGGGLEEVRKLLAVREPLYASAAHVTLDVSSLSIDGAIKAVTELIQRHPR
jgi:shikimate kinase